MTKKLKAVQYIVQYDHYHYHYHSCESEITQSDNQTTRELWALDITCLTNFKFYTAHYTE